MAHAGGSGGGRHADPLHRLAAEEPNVFLDLASSVGGYGQFADVVKVAGAKKLLFGSDTPWMCYTHQIGRVLMAEMTEAEKRLVLGENMAALLATRR